MATDTKQGIRSVTRKVLGIAGLLGAAALFQGCFVDSGSGGTCFPGVVRTSWILTENGARVACEPGDEVDLRVDTDAMTVTFPCSDGVGTSLEVTGGAFHNVSLKLFDVNGTLLSQTGVMSIAVGCDSVTSTPQVDFSLTP